MPSGENRGRGLITGPHPVMKMAVTAGPSRAYVTEIALHVRAPLATKTKIDIDVTLEMLAAGLQVLVDSGVLDQTAGRELPAGAVEVPVADIYKAMARVRSREGATNVAPSQRRSPTAASAWRCSGRREVSRRNCGGNTVIEYPQGDCVRH